VNEEQPLNDEDAELIRQLGDALAKDPRWIKTAGRDDLDERTREAIQEAAAASGESLLVTLLDDAPRMLAEHRERREAFEDDIREFWGDALGMYETLHVCCKEAARDFYEEYLPDPHEPHDYVFDALTRLQGRASLVAGEVLTLLRAGYPSGAHARWRTIHELAVVAFFISEHGHEIARRYLGHDAIQRHKSAVLYNAYHEQLGYEPFTSGEFEAVKKAYDAALAEFGPGFGNDWGWAIPALGRAPLTFRSIEQVTGLSHFRPYYRMASDAVHPNVHGSFFDLGLQDQRAILVGPSPLGFADPAHGACLSLFQVTVCLLNFKPGLRGLMIINALGRLVDQIGEAFLEAQHRAEAEMKAGRWEPTEATAGPDPAAQ
jgi:hypothetical protein